jgi:hypothetical protein
VGAIEINVEQWPVCYIKIDGDQSLEDFERYIDAFNRFYHRAEPFSIITWLKSYSVNRDLIARTARWFKETEELSRKYWVSNAMLTKSPGFRFVLSTMFLIKPFTIPSQVCASPAEAIEFTRARWSNRKPGLPESLSWPY